MVFVYIQLFASFVAAGNVQSNRSASSEGSYHSIENFISSPPDSWQGCEQWFYEIASRNQDQCIRPIIPPIPNSTPSIDGHAHKLYQGPGLPKLTDGRYRCRPPRNMNGCNRAFLEWFKRQQFYMLCRPIDGIESQLVFDDNIGIEFGSRTISIDRDPEITLIKCGKQDNHQQLIIARERTVDQVRQILISHLGHDLTFCIDQKL